MEATKSRLGRGLDSLLGGNEHGADGQNGTPHVPLDTIHHNPYQPRKRFDDEELEQLAASIREHGVLQPITVRQHEDHFQLIAGERRLRAARAAGLNAIPVHIVQFDEQRVYEAALAENIQRSDLNPIEKAQGFKDYLDRFGVTQEQLAGKLGIDRSSVSNLINLLNLAADVQDAVRLGQISLGHAKVLKGIADMERQSALCKQIVLQNLSVRALEALLKEQAAAAANDTPPEKDKPGPVEKTPHVLGIETDLRQRLATKVEIKVKAQDRGQIVIGFESNDEFERLTELLRR